MSVAPGSVACRKHDFLSLGTVRVVCKEDHAYVGHVWRCLSKDRSLYSLNRLRETVERFHVLSKNGSTKDPFMQQAPGLSLYSWNIIMFKAIV